MLAHLRAQSPPPRCPRLPPHIPVPPWSRRRLCAPSRQFEGEKEDILANLYQFNLATQLYGAMLENVTSEQASKMTAMDSATTNANDMISKLTIRYNRQRQAKVTTELTEIVAGAESV